VHLGAVLPRGRGRSTIPIRPGVPSYSHLLTADHQARRNGWPCRAHLPPTRATKHDVVLSLLPHRVERPDASEHFHPDDGLS